MCISSSARCDGRYDCPRGDDEDKCEHYTPHHEMTVCSKEEFSCHKDNACIPYEMVCDGIKQCMDGSDEIFGCKEVEKNCPVTGFLCKNKHCLTNRNWVCDGVDDCGDNSDEEQNCCKYFDVYLCILIESNRIFDFKIEFSFKLTTVNWKTTNIFAAITKPVFQ